MNSRNGGGATECHTPDLHRRYPYRRRMATRLPVGHQRVIPSVQRSAVGVKESLLGQVTQGKNSPGPLLPPQVEFRQSRKLIQSQRNNDTSSMPAGRGNSGIVRSDKSIPQSKRLRSHANTPSTATGAARGRDRLGEISTEDTANSSTGSAGYCDGDSTT